LVKSQVQRAGFFRLTSRLWHWSRIADWKSRIVFSPKMVKVLRTYGVKHQCCGCLKGLLRIFITFFWPRQRYVQSSTFQVPSVKKNLCPILHCPLTATQGRVRLGCTRDTRVNWRKAEGLALAHFIWV
jgi:hypothetical protein